VRSAAIQMIHPFMILDRQEIVALCFHEPQSRFSNEHEPAFVANPNVVTFYNQGQAYLRNAVSIEGDRCDWFGVEIDVVQDVVRVFDPTLDARPDRPFNLTRGWADASTYLAQRRLFEQLVTGALNDPLMIEESIVDLLEQVVQSAYKTTAIVRSSIVGPRQRDMIHHIEFILSRQWGECLSLRELANEVGISVYHLCRMFRRATDPPSINIVKNCASVALLRASWNLGDRWWILLWMRDFPAIATTPTPSARNLLGPRPASDPTRPQNQHVAREQDSDSEIARDRLVDRSYADKHHALHSDNMSCFISFH